MGLQRNGSERLRGTMGPMLAIAKPETRAMFAPPSGRRARGAERRVCGRPLLFSQESMHKLLEPTAEEVVQALLELQKSIMRAAT